MGGVGEISQVALYGQISFWYIYHSVKKETDKFTRIKVNKFTRSRVKLLD